MMGEATTATIPGQREPQNPSSSDDLARYRKYIRAFETNKLEEQNESREARKYYNDKQWTDKELKTLKRRKQHPVVDNVIKRKVDFLVGVEQRMRRDPKAYPRTPKHEHDADTATAGIRFVCDKNRWESISSDAMHDGLVSGIGVAWIGIKRGKDGVLDVDMKRIDPARFIYDSRSMRPDFKDARWSGVDIWMDIDEAKEGVDEETAKKLDNLIDSNKGNVSALPAEIDQAEQWGDYENSRVRMVELYELRVAPPYNVAQWHYCKFAGDVKIEAYVSPYQDEYGQPANPYEAWSPYVDEKGNRYGVFRTMKTLQDSINYKRSRLDHEIGSRQTFSNRGGAVEDVDKLKEEVQKPDGHLEFQGGEWMKDVGIVDRSQVIRGQAELLLDAQQRLENYGPNPGLLGKGDGMADASGRALLAQRDSGMTELSPVFERQRDWKLRVYRAVWSRIRQAWTGERWIAITDDPKAVQFIPVNQYQMVVDPQTGRPSISGQNIIAQIDVDVILDEGPDTIVMREELMQTLANLGEAAVGPLGKVMIELSNAPNKDQLIQMMDQATAPPPEVAEMQARLAALEQAQQAAQADKTTAESGNKRADTLVKIIQALTPPQQATDEFGNPTGPAPQPPNIALAMKLMEMLEPQIPADPQPAMPQQPQAPQGGPIPPDFGQMPPMLPAEGQMMPNGVMQ
jgi:hypothetical protein